MSRQPASQQTATRYGWSVVCASWLAVFCLFGYRATFAILKGPMSLTLGWSAAEVTLGYSLMMVVYAVTAYFGGLILDRWGGKPTYALAAIFGGLGFALTAQMRVYAAYLVTFGLLGGLATGMLWVTSTVSVRRWYVGRTYATRWGIAFAGAPMAQFALAQLVGPRLSAAQAALEATVFSALGMDTTAFPATERSALLVEALTNPLIRTAAPVAEALAALEAAWRGEMLLLGAIVLTLLAIAAFIGKRHPEHYGFTPFGAEPQEEPSVCAWQLRDAFSRYAIWGVMLTFLASMMAEFLIWTQVVSYWTDDVGYSLQQATNTYAVIGLVGIVSMPLMGRIADAVVARVGREALGRKLLLVIGPLIGAAACGLLLHSQRLALAYAACVLFAIYWAIVPGSVVGYTGALYGCESLGRIWGLATLIVMGIGPFAGSYIGGLLRDLTGSYTFAIAYALGSFLASVLLALTLPLALREHPA